MANDHLFASSVPNANDEAKVVRRSAHYHPSIWGDSFINLFSQHKKESNESGKRQVEELTKEINWMLRKESKPIQKMNLVDALQRLGIAYHFEKEIEEILQQMYEDDNYGNSLHGVALRFRLLRQQGFRISSDVFGKFKDNEGSFNTILSEDVRALLSLYEASHLHVDGEDILDEVLDFTSKKLKSMLSNLDPRLREQVKYTLELPLHKGMPRLEARHYISVYEEDENKNMILLQLAKLDFNLLQSLHQREIRDISRWWKDLGLASQLPFARDRVVELYYWMLGVYFEPQFSLGRIQLTKVSQLISLIDDIYDLHGTLDELVLFTEAVNRWDLRAMNQLPEYMKVCYQALYNTTSEIENENMREGRGNNIDYLKKSFKDLCKVYLKEAQWYNAGLVPTLDEYLRVASTSAAYVALITVAAINMGEIVTKEALDWIVGECNAVRCSSLIARLCDDIATYQEEQERGDAPSSVQCYMKQLGASEQQACEHIRKLIVNAWKGLNEECLKPSAVPTILRTCIVNFARMAEVIYQHGDGYGTSTRETKDNIAKLLIDPVPI